MAASAFLQPQPLLETHSCPRPRSCQDSAVTNKDPQQPQSLHAWLHHPRKAPRGAPCAPPTPGHCPVTRDPMICHCISSLQTSAWQINIQKYFEQITVRMTCLIGIYEIWRYSLRGKYHSSPLVMASSTGRLSRAQTALGAVASRKMHGTPTAGVSSLLGQSCGDLMASVSLSSFLSCER